MTAAAALKLAEPEDRGSAKESVMIADEWMRLRSSVMHDWLSAKAYLGTLQTIGLVFEGKVERPGFSIANVREALAQWRVRRGDIERLVVEFEAAMSPASMVSRPPLSRLDREVRDVLANLVDRLWRHRRNVPELDAQLRLALADCDKAHERLSRITQERNASIQQHRVAVKFGEFHRKVRRLHEALCELPSKIAVT